MAEEFVSIAKESCHEMLLTATECFRMAGRCERDSTEDDWLYNYMIGKCMEKAGKPLGDYLPYYFKVIRYRVHPILVFMPLFEEDWVYFICWISICLSVGRPVCLSVDQFVSDP